MTRILPWLLPVVLGIIWGTNFLFMKPALAVIPPLEVAWLRTLFGAVFAGEAVGMRLVAGALLIMGGLYYAIRPERIVPATAR